MSTGQEGATGGQDAVATRVDGGEAPVGSPGAASRADPPVAGPSTLDAGGTGGRSAGPGVNGAGGGGRRGDGDEVEGGRMTLYEHIAELRTRLLICVAAIVVTAIAGWFLYEPVLRFMSSAYKDYCHTHPKHLLTCNLVTNTPVQGFLTRLQLSFYIAIVLAAPVWLWELWGFITPGLKKREKQYAVPFVLSAVTLFAMGVGVAVLVWPKALNWLIGVSGSGVTQVFTLNSYISLYTLICIVFGVVFLYPIVVVFLMISGVVPSAKWRKWRRPAIVVIFAVAAIVTPSNDPFTFAGMAVPMVIFYEASIILGRLMKK